MQNDSERTHRLRCLSTRATSEEDSRKKKKSVAHVTSSRHDVRTWILLPRVLFFVFFVFFFKCCIKRVASNDEKRR